jgi:Holliday junction resolvase
MSQPQEATTEWGLFCGQINELTARPPRKPKAQKPVTANQLTTKIIQFFGEQGHFATRQPSTGTYRADLGKFVHSQQRPGCPDLYAIVQGFHVAVEVKVGRDQLSEVQRKTIAAIEQSKGFVFVARDFDSFRDWYFQVVVLRCILP